MENPLVSILCLCYNQAKFVVESLESVKAQTYSNFEVLICDDASADNSVEVVEQWINKNSEIPVQFIRHAENRGICKSLNELFALSKGKYIQMLALDDILLPNKLDRHVTILERSQENEAMVFSDAMLIDDNSADISGRFINRKYENYYPTTGNFYKILLNKNFIPAMSVLLKSEVIKQVGGWDENLTYEDYDMWLRLSKTYNFIYDKEFSCRYRIHTNNTHKNSDFMRNSYVNIFIKHIENPIVKKRLFMIIEKMYLNGTLENEHRIFFNRTRTTSISEYMVKNNWPRPMYKLVKILSKIYYN